MILNVYKFRNYTYHIVVHYCKVCLADVKNPELTLKISVGLLKKQRQDSSWIFCASSPLPNSKSDT